MNGTPVILVVYNRPRHTAKVLESLRRHNVQNLYIFSDASKSPQHSANVGEVRRLIHDIKWCKPVIVERAENFGLARSIVSAANMVFEQYDRLILLEDDCVPGPYFFDFMAKCLKKYEAHPGIFGISGHTVPIAEDVLKAYPYDIYFSPRIGSWGWATWRRAWKYYDTDINRLVETAKAKNIDWDQGGNDWPMMLLRFLKGELKDVWTMNWVLSVYNNNGSYIFPTKTHITNIGTDGSGEHCGKTSVYDSELSDIEPKRFPEKRFYDRGIISEFWKRFDSKPRKSISLPICGNTPDLIKVAHINTHDAAGGAAAVAQMLMRPDGRGKWNTFMLVGHKLSNDRNVELIKDIRIDSNNKYGKYGYLYYDIYSTFKIDQLPQFKQADIIHLHNLHGHYFNPFALVAISNLKPVVWTLHDMQSITGHCAHSFDCDRFKTGCGNCPYLKVEPAISTDTSAALWKDKKLIYENSNLQIVVPSNWLADKVSQSILRDKPLEVIHNGIDTEIFKPLDKQAVRKKLNIPADAVVLAFSANGGVNNPWRDSQCLADTMKYLTEKKLPVVFLNIGSDSNAFNMPNTINIGNVKDNKVMAALYSAADILLFPSLADNCPLAVMEAMACNCPVVAYRTGGIPEIVEHNKNGIIVDYKDRDAFIKIVEFLCGNSRAVNMLSSAARERILNNFSKDVMLDKYGRLYENLLQRPADNKRTLIAADVKIGQEKIQVKATEEMFSCCDYLKNIKRSATVCDAAVPEVVKAAANNFKGNKKFIYPKISIVTPSFNQADYLEYCIRSVLDQGYPNLEYIVIDGGSTDGSVDIIRKYQSQLTYWVSEPDNGQYHAIMKGFAKASGEIMGWINSDDMLHSRCLWILADLFTANPDVEFLTGRRIGFDGEGSLQAYIPDLITWSRQKLLDKENIHKKNLFVMQEGTYWRRSLWEKAGASLDLSLELAGDFELWLRFSRYARLHTVNTLLGGFRGYSKGQRCQRLRDKYIAECDKVIDRELSVKSDFSDAAAPPVMSYSIYNQLAKDSASKPAKSCDVSIVLCTMNRAELLDKMLASVPAAAAGINYEIVVVAGNCPDNTLEILKKHNVTKIYNEQEHLGPGKHSWPMLYNFAFSKANGKWAMFASDDIIFGENCLRNAVKVLDVQPDNVAGGIFFYKNLQRMPAGDLFAHNKFFIGMGREFNILMNYGLLRLDDFRKVDGFDEAYNFYYADSDLCNKLYSIGRILLPLPASLIAHNDILDNLKQDNASKVQADLIVYHSKWGSYCVNENNRPHRLIWQQELVGDYLLPVDENTTAEAINSYWRGLAFFQRAQYRQAKEQFEGAINEGLSDSKIYDYMNKCGGKIKNENICGIIFSKDRAMQLKAAIQSFMNCCIDKDKIKLQILYKASNPLHQKQYEKLKNQFNDVAFIKQGDFKDDVKQLLTGFEYVLFLVDDNIFVSDFSIEKIISSLNNQTDCLGFSLRLGRNTTYCYAKDTDQNLPDFERLENNILKFDWTKAQFDFNYPLEVSSSVYRIKDIMLLIEQLRFDNPNMFEGLMALNAGMFAAAKSNLLCFSSSAAFCNPANMVQSVSPNRSAGRNEYNANALAELFENGYQIDVERYRGFVSNGCHQEVEFYFTKPPSDKKTAPIVSVEMVTYNAEKYIGQAITSVLQQSFDDFELIIVDDGSTDNTGKIVNSFSDQRIKYIRREHCGCAASRNCAISSACGEYILCVDSDDFIAADYIESMVEYARRFPEFDFYYPAQLTLVDGQGSDINCPWKYEDFSDNRILPAVLFANGFSPIPNPGSLIRRNLFEKCGLYEDCQTVEDFVFLCKNATKIRFNRTQINSSYFYRRLSQSASQNFEPRDRITAQTLNQMLAIYSPDMICPSLAEVSDPYIAKTQYYKYVSDIFYRHASGSHFVKYGQYFRKFGDFYKDRFLVMMQNQPLNTAQK